MDLSGEQYDNITQEADEDDITIVRLMSQLNSKPVDRRSEDQHSTIVNSPSYLKAFSQECHAQYNENKFMELHLN